MRILLIALIVATLPLPCLAQNEPAVLVHVDIDPTGNGGRYAIANGVVVGRNKDDSLNVITNAHVVMQAVTVKVRVAGQWIDAEIKESDPVNDMSILHLPGSFPSVPLAVLKLSELPIGTRAKYCGFLPPNYQLGCIPTVRVRDDKLRWYAFKLNAQQGMSGGGLYSLDGYLVGLLSCGSPGQTEVIPSTVIAIALNEWGYTKKQKQSLATLPPVANEEPAEILVTEDESARRDKILFDSLKGLQAQIEAMKQSPEVATLPPGEQSSSPGTPPVEQGEPHSRPAPGGTLDSAKSWVWDKASELGWWKAAAYFGGPIGLAVGVGGMWLHRKLRGSSENVNREEWSPNAWRPTTNQVPPNPPPPPPRSNYRTNCHPPQDRYHPVIIENPPPQQATSHSVHYAPYETDTTAEAFAWAKSEFGRRYPGSIGTLETITSMMDQFISGKKTKKD